MERGKDYLSVIVLNQTLMQL